MARSLRLEFSGAYYHVMARGNRREPMFRDELDRTFFLRTMRAELGSVRSCVRSWGQSTYLD